MLTLERRQVDLDAGANGTIRLDPGSTKNDDGRVVYLTPGLNSLLTAQLARVDTLQRQTKAVVRFLFPHLEGRQRRGQRIRDFRRAWASACLAAGLAVKIEREGRAPLVRTSRTRHDFRRAAVRNMEQAGVPRSVAMKLTGHRTENIYRPYAIVSPADLQDAARRIAAMPSGQESGQVVALKRERG